MRRPLGAPQHWTSSSCRSGLPVGGRQACFSLLSLKVSSSIVQECESHSRSCWQNPCGIAGLPNPPAGSRNGQKPTQKRCQVQTHRRNKAAGNSFHAQHQSSRVLRQLPLLTTARNGSEEGNCTEEGLPCQEEGRRCQAQEGAYETPRTLSVLFINKDRVWWITEPLSRADALRPVVGWVCVTCLCS